MVQRQQTQISRQAGNIGMAHMRLVVELDQSRELETAQLMHFV